MLGKYVLQDIIGACLLLTGCLIGGLAVNELRCVPLAWVYSPSEGHLSQNTRGLNPSTPVSFAADEGIDRDEMQKLSLNHGALVVDARPEKQYELGHIPSAVSLPRNDFDKHYQALQSILQSHRDQPVIVYCGNFRCPDSQIVAVELQKLGYQHVRLFRAGWDDWQMAGLPEEKQ